MAAEGGVLHILKPDVSLWLLTGQHRWVAGKHDQVFVGVVAHVYAI